MSRTTLRTVEFGLLATLGIGAGLHVAQNAATKALMRTKGGNRVLASVFQSGQRHARKGRQLHPAIRRTSDFVLGPEYSEMYEKGLASGRISKGALGRIRDKVRAGSRYAETPIEKTLSNVTAGPQNRWLSKMMDRLPTKDIRHKSKGWFGGALAGAATAVAEPVLPAINGIRTAVARSKLGERVISKAFRSGADGKRMNPLMRALSDYVGSPSLAAAQDAGTSLRNRVLTGIRSIRRPR